MTTEFNPAESGFTWKPLGISGYWSLKLTETFEVCLEPRIFGGWLLAVYKDGDLAMKEKLDLLSEIAMPDD